jgi:hypothetical protein
MITPDKITKNILIVIVLGHQKRWLQINELTFPFSPRPLIGLNDKVSSASHKIHISVVPASMIDYFDFSR